MPHTAPRVLTPSEAQAVLAALEDASLHRLASLAIHTGLRKGELLGLRWQDVDLHRQELHVTQSLQRIEGEYRLVEVKSSSS
ncbi:integrase family protein, partial [mine drainage metagenome]